MSPVRSYTEAELVSALRSRDNSAFNYLYDHYSGALYSVITQMVENTETASDLLQEVFINIWRKIETYDPLRGRLFTWMLNIARNASIDSLRSRAYQNSRKNQELSDHVNTSIKSQVTQTNIDSIGLKKILAKLKPEHRTLIDLAYFKGYTHEEIADIEQIPLGTVKTRIRNALIQLKEYLL